MNLLDRLETVSNETIRSIESCQTSRELEDVRVKVFGKKSALSEITAKLKDLSPDEKKTIGAKAHTVREELGKRLQQKAAELEAKEMEADLLGDKLDSSLPGNERPQGNIHPIRRVLSEAISILEKAGLQPMYGPEVEYEEYCFDRLNFKPGHAARDMQATFFIREAKKPLVLRTHTSPVQVRVLLKAAAENFPLPIRIQAPGRVYRVDDDATHAPMFHQIEGLAVDKRSTMGDLRAVLDFFMRKFFDDESVKVRFRPSYFPFTEPSAEVDVSCVFCKQKGCRVCKHSGWIEVAGAGMVHPEVFKACGWNADDVQGWAFGMGVERLSMLKLGVPDLRLFFENRLSFLRAGA